MKLSSIVTAAALSCLGVFAFAQDDQESTPVTPPRPAFSDFLLRAILDSTSQNQVSTAEQIALRRRQTELAEDMEIIAQIVHENVGLQYPQFLGAVVDPHAHVTDFLGDIYQLRDDTSLRQVTPTNNELSQPLVDYLPGHGVAIQLRVPAPRVARAEAKEKAESITTSRWERTKKRLRGKDVQHQLWGRQCGACHEASTRWNVNQYWLSMYGKQQLFGSATGNLVRGPTKSSLVQAIVTALAENGHNVRGLDPSERITVSLNYWHEDESPASASSAGDSQKSSGQGPEPSKESGKKATNEDPQKSAEAASDLQHFSFSVNALRALSSKASEGDVQPKTQNAIDRSIIEERIKAGLSSSLTASRTNLVKRLYVDLLGIPPTTHQIQDFLSDRSSDAYQRLVDRMLKSGDYSDLWVRQWANEVTNEFTGAKSRSRQRGRITVSATSDQLAKVASQELSEMEFMQQVQIGIFEP